MGLGGYPPPTTQPGWPPAWVTALPAAPYDGQEVYYYVADGVVWHLRYRAAISDAYKWEVLGAPPPLTAEFVNQEALAVVLTTYQSLSGPAVTLPLAGYYDVELGGYGYSSNASGTSTNVYMTVKLGAAAASDNESILIGAQGFLAWNAYRRLRRGPLAAGAVLQTQYRGSSTAGTYNVGGRSISAYPLRVG
jgi:hypothetical protein